MATVGVSVRRTFRTYGFRADRRPDHRTVQNFRVSAGGARRHAPCTTGPARSIFTVRPNSDIRRRLLSVGGDGVAGMRDRQARASRRRAPRVIAAAAGGLLVAVLPAPVAVARHGGKCENRSNNSYDKLLECVTLDGVREHQQALQDIADKNQDPYYPGTRADGTEGYEGSADYVAGLLEKAGYDVTRQPVEFEFAFPAELRQLTPVEAEYDTGPFAGSGAGTVEGRVVPIDINLDKGPDAVSTSGCEPEDFAPYDWSGDADIALVQRGTCFFGTKAYYAEQAGAEAVIVFHQGNTPRPRGVDRRGRQQRRRADPGGARSGHARHPRGGCEL